MKPLSNIGALIAAMFLLLACKPSQTQAAPIFGVSSDDGTNSLEFHFAAQFQWDYLYQDNLDELAYTSESKLRFRRIRPVLKGKLFSKDISWLLHLSTAPGSLELMDLWLDYNIHKWLKVRMGQMKIPFTRYRLGSYKNLPVVDWSYPSKYFGAERQMGIMLHNNIKNPPSYEFQLGLFNGLNARAANGIGMEKIYHVATPNPSSLIDPQPQFEKMHSELVLHLAYNLGSMKGRDWAENESPMGLSLGLSTAWDLSPRATHDMHLRIAPELEFRWSSFSLGALLYLGLVDMVQTDSQYSPGLMGGLVYARYMFGENYELALRLAGVWVLEKLRDDALSRANSIIDAEPDEATRQELSKEFSSLGHLHSEQELTLGFNCYLYGNTLKWQSDIGLVMHKMDDGDLLDARARTQLQLAF